MLQSVSNYLDAACRGIKNAKRQQAVRAELAGHVQDTISELMNTGVSEEEAASTAILRMGEAAEVSQKLAAANRESSHAVTALAGLAFVVIILCIGIGRSGGMLSYFIDFPAFFMVALCTVGFSLISGLRGLPISVILKRASTYALYAGGLSCVLSIILMLRNLSDPAALGPSISAALIGILYGLLLSGITHALGILLTPQESALSLLGIE